MPFNFGPKNTHPFGRVGYGGRGSAAQKSAKNPNEAFLQPGLAHYPLSNPGPGKPGMNRMPQSHSHANRQPQGYPRGGAMSQGRPPGNAVSQGNPPGDTMPQGYPQTNATSQGRTQGYPQGSIASTPQGHQQANATPQGRPQGNTTPQGYPQVNAIPMPQGYQQANAMPQGYLQGNTTPQGYPQGNAGPQTQADQLKAINKTLPDGVRYEPLDEQTIKMLQAKGKLPHRANQAQPQPSTAMQPSSAGAAQPPQPATASASAPPAMPQPVASTPATAASIPEAPVASPSPAATAPPSFTPPPPVSSIPASVSDPENAALLERLMQDERNATVFYRHLTELAPRADAKSALATIASQCADRLAMYRGVLQRLHQREFTPQETVVNTLVTFREGIALAILEENKSLQAVAGLLENINDEASVKTIQSIIYKKMANHNILSWINQRTVNGLF